MATSVSGGPPAIADAQSSIRITNHFAERSFLPHQRLLLPFRLVIGSECLPSKLDVSVGNLRDSKVDADGRAHKATLSPYKVQVQRTHLDGDGATDETVILDSQV